MTRLATGPVVMPGDSAGVFIRDDEALAHAAHLRAMLEHIYPQLHVAQIGVLVMLVELLESCRDGFEPCLIDWRQPVPEATR